MLNLHGTLGPMPVHRFRQFRKAGNVRVLVNRKARHRGATGVAIRRRRTNNDQSTPALGDFLVIGVRRRGNPLASESDEENL